MNCNAGLQKCFGSLYSRSTPDVSMKSCAWEWRTWVMRNKQRDTAWRWRGGFLDHTGWGFLSSEFSEEGTETIWLLSTWSPELFRNSFDVMTVVCKCLCSREHESLWWQKINRWCRLSFFLSYSTMLVESIVLPLKEATNWSSVWWKWIDYCSSIVSATIKNTRHLFCCWWSFFSIQRCVISQDLHFFGGNLFHLHIWSKELPHVEVRSCTVEALLQPKCVWMEKSDALIQTTFKRYSFNIWWFQMYWDEKLGRPVTHTHTQTDMDFICAEKQEVRVFRGG